MIVVGGGIVGLATAMALTTRHPRLQVLVLEKESALAAHQTSHNSGVIHSGIYYRPGSAKARLCVAGARALIAFCQTHHIPYQRCGKVIVATDAAELPALHTLYDRARANGVPHVALIGPERLRELEPHVRGVKALLVPGTGITDFAAVARTLAEMVRRQGGEITTSARVLALRRGHGGWVLDTTAGAFQATWLVTCGGLFADQLARQGGAPDDVRIMPFRGEYYRLRAAAEGVVQRLIYPVPDPRFPFLGVHFTRLIHGGVEAGPNAVLAWKREGYRKMDVELAELWRQVTYAGFWRMSRRYWRTGVAELYRSWHKRAFVRALQRLVPAIQADDLIAGGAGVRAQAVNRQGALLDDFDIVTMDHAMHVRNAPSPAATASLAIGETIAERFTPPHGA